MSGRHCADCVHATAHQQDTLPASRLQHGAHAGSFAWRCIALQTPAALWPHAALPGSACAAGSPASVPAPAVTLPWRWHADHQPGSMLLSGLQHLLAGLGHCLQPALRQELTCDDATTAHASACGTCIVSTAALAATQRLRASQPLTAACTRWAALWRLSCWRACHARQQDCSRTQAACCCVYLQSTSQRLASATRQRSSTSRHACVQWTAVACRLLAAVPASNSLWHGRA